MRAISLRVKFVYFQRILSGEKTVEYRDASRYYEHLMKQRPDFILFCCDGQIARARVTKVERIPTPERLKSSQIKFGPEVYALSLADAVLL